jgi:hypothetical protein
MIYLIVFAAIFGGLGWMAFERSKTSTKLYAKIAAISLFFISVFFAYQYVYYYGVGVNTARFGNNGVGVSILNPDTGNSTVFYSLNDLQVKEYFAQEYAAQAVIPILSSILPLLAILLGGYFIWYYVEEAMHARDEDRST